MEVYENWENARQYLCNILLIDKPKNILHRNCQI